MAAGGGRVEGYQTSFPSRTVLENFLSRSAQTRPVLQHPITGRDEGSDRLEALVLTQPPTPKSGGSHSALLSARPAALLPSARGRTHTTVSWRYF